MCWCITCIFVWQSLAYLVWRQCSQNKQPNCAGVWWTTCKTNMTNKQPCAQCTYWHMWNQKKFSTLHLALMTLLMWALAVLFRLLVTPMSCSALPASSWLLPAVLDLARYKLQHGLFWSSSWEAALPSVLDSFDPCILLPFSSSPCRSPLSFWLGARLSTAVDFDGLVPDYHHWCCPVNLPSAHVSNATTL